MSERLTRRAVLALSSVTAVSLAGCSGGGDDSGDQDSDAPGDSKGSANGDGTGPGETGGAEGNGTDGSDGTDESDDTDGSNEDEESENGDWEAGSEPTVRFQGRDTPLSATTVDATYSREANELEYSVTVENTGDTAQTVYAIGVNVSEGNTSYPKANSQLLDEPVEVPAGGETTIEDTIVSAVFEQRPAGYDGGSWPPAQFGEYELTPVWGPADDRASGGSSAGTVVQLPPGLEITSLSEQVVNGGYEVAITFENTGTSNFEQETNVVDYNYSFEAYDADGREVSIRSGSPQEFDVEIPVGEQGTVTYTLRPNDALSTYSDISNIDSYLIVMNCEFFAQGIYCRRT